MINAISKAIMPDSCLLVELDTVRKIHGSSTFSSKKTSQRPQDTLVALRTLKGSGIIYFSESQICVGADSLILFLFSEYQSCMTKEDDWEFYWLEFRTPSPIFPTLKQVFEIAQTDTEYALLLECFNNLSVPVPYASMFASSLFSALIAKWLMSIRQNDTPYSREIETATKYIVQNLSSNISVATLAKYVGMSERLFRNAFSKHTSKTPQQYIEDLKMETAKQFLRDTKISIKDISFSLGYANQYYFSRAFKKNFCLSPMKYRVSIQI